MNEQEATDLDERVTRKASRRVRNALFIAVLVAAILNSEGLLLAARGLPVGPVEDVLVRLAETWHTEMARQRAAGPYQKVRDFVRSLQSDPSAR